MMRIFVAVKPLLFAALVLFTGGGLFSMEWPSPSGIMMRNFGSNYSGVPHLGVSFADSGMVAAAEAGELLFKRNAADNASRLPSPLGSWVALDHGDGLISIYSRFDHNFSVQIPNLVERGAALGQSGVSGWSSQNGFFFQFFDREGRRWVNPSLVIRTTNPRVPVILQVGLMDAQGAVVSLPYAGNLNQGRYTILVNAISGSPAVPLAPFRIISTLNGSEAGSLNFEAYFVRDGTLVVYRNGLIPARRVHAPAPGFEVADVWLTRGQATLEIIAEDISGITRNVIHRFMVE